MVRDMVSRFGHVYNLGTGNPAVMKLLSYKRYDGSVLEFSVSDSLALMSNLFSELLKTGTEKTSLTPGSLIVRKAVKYIFEHINENFNVRDIAEHTGVSPEHFSRVFKAETGLTPMDYLAREKMEHACEMLKGTNFSCKEIRARLGYDNSSHFARAFRRVTGFSPNEYRKRGIFSGINEKDL
jgi:AraC-like DNA-binding protein